MMVIKKLPLVELTIIYVFNIFWDVYSNCNVEGLMFCLTAAKSML